jgi:hypothetical protein
MTTGKREAEWVSLRRAGVMLGGRAPTTVKDLVHDGELQGTTILTEAGHARRYVSIASITAYLARQCPGTAQQAA